MSLPQAEIQRSSSCQYDHKSHPASENPWVQSVQNSEMVLGVGVSTFEELARLHPGLSTGQLCESVIKPATQATASSYLAVLQEQKKETGPATCFISHAWMTPFADVVDCVQQHASKHPNSFFWFDLFLQRNPLSGGHPPFVRASLRLEPCWS